MEKFYLLRTSYRKREVYYLSLFYSHDNMKNSLLALSKMAYQNIVCKISHAICKEEITKSKIKMKLVRRILAFLFYQNDVCIIE